MHEIKFRVWDKKWNLMFHNDILLRSGQELVTFAKIHSTDPAIQNAYGGLLLPTDDPNMVFMQYTGLKDNNGVEIYEDDIVKGYCYLNGKLHRIIGKVVYRFCYFCIDGIGQYTCIRNVDLDPSYEVIGNIYENPELLNKDGGAK